jgi:hypothetical protein
MAPPHKPERKVSTTRFISQYPNYGVQVRRQLVQPLGDGTRQVLQEGLYVTFTSADKGGMIFETERYRASEYFSFHGSQQEQDEATPIDPIHRLSVLDTVEDAKERGWSGEEVELIERELIKLTRETPQALVLIEGTPIPAPYPNYDLYDGDPQELVLKLTADGHDLGEVLLYEQNFGPRRPELIEALEIAQEALKELTVHG